MNKDQRIPIILLTGFLGSGKTTVLSRLLRLEAFSDTAVIINEFGEIPLDGDLVLHEREQIIETSSGCLCCTIRGDVQKTLATLLEKRNASDAAPFQRVVIETTGLADPSPIIATLTSDWRLAEDFVFAGIVTTADALHLFNALDHHDESLKQIAVADAVLLTKTDLIHSDERADRVAELRARIQRINPEITILLSDAAEEAFHTAQSQSGYDLKRHPEQVQAWLNEAAYRKAEHDDHQHHHDHQHDVNTHGDDIHAFSIILEEPMHGFPLMMAIDLLRASLGTNLLRFKAILLTADAPEQPVVLHAVQHTLHKLERLPDWPSEDRRSRMVFITRSLSKPAVEKYFKRFAQAAKSACHTQPSAQNATADTTR
jgi:G3E family GTPase